jgi:hypothetical protein
MYSSCWPSPSESNLLSAGAADRRRAAHGREDPPTRESSGGAS